MYTPLGVSSHIGPRQDSPPDEAQSSDLTSLPVVLDVCLRLPPEATVITCMNFDLPGASKREKDVCQYYIYIERPSRQRAEQVEREIERIASPWTGDYIWQDESFAVKIDSGEDSPLVMTRVCLIDTAQTGVCLVGPDSETV